MFLTNVQSESERNDDRMSEKFEEFYFSPDRMMDRSAIFYDAKFNYSFLHDVLYVRSFIPFHDLYSVMQYCIQMAYHFLGFHCIFHCVDTNQI